MEKKLVLQGLLILSLNAAFAQNTEIALNSSAENSIKTESAPPDQELIMANSSWQFLDNGSNQGSAWRNTMHNDEGDWNVGNAGFSYENDGDKTFVEFGSSPIKKHITTYFRKSFLVGNASSFNALELSLMRDDGAVIYLNGIEIFRSNMPSGSIYYNTLAPTYIEGAGETTYIVQKISKSALKDGENIIAVEIHQNSPSSTDLTFDLKLKGIINSEPMADIGNSIESSNEGMAFSGADFILFPDPATGSYKFEFCMDNVKDEKPTVEIINIIGQTVYQKEPSKKDGCIREVIELEKGLPTGLYRLNIRSSKGLQSSQAFVMN